MADQDRDVGTPVGYKTVTIEPSRTGLSYPLYLKVEEVVDDKSAISQEGLFVPRNDVEAENVLNFVNQKRQSEELKPVSMETYNANQSLFMKYAIGQYQITEEGKKSTDPINYYGNKFQKYMDKLKSENPTEDFEGMEAFRRPRDFAFSQLVNIGETVSDFLPTEKGDFALGGELLGSLPAMAAEISMSAPGAAKIPGTVYKKVMAGGAGVVTGSALGRAGGTATYDFINDLIRAAGGIEQPSETADPGMQALAEMRNSAMFTTMAAGLGPAFAAARPVVGKILGLGQDGSAMSKLAEKYGIPIGISIAATGQNLGSAVKGFGKVVGVFPLIGTLMKERQLRSLIKTKQAVGKQAELIGDPAEYYRAQYKLMNKDDKAIFMKDLKENGYNSLDEAIEAEVRINGFAPIQHLTDVGMFMHKAAEDRYKRFSYINDLLYKTFEKTSEKISKPFIATNNTKNIGKLLQDRINQYKTTLEDGRQYSPALNEVEDFIVNTLGNLPQYITPMQLRGFQRQLNNLYGRMKSDTGMNNFAGSDVLAEARKALTTDLNNFAGWRQGLSEAEMIAAESAKKSLLRANSVFSKMSPLYKSPQAKKFKLIDDNMFSAGPELPGWNYSDELFNIVMKNKMTPQAAVDLKELVGEAAYDSVVRTWIDKGFKNALRIDNPIDIAETISTGAGKTKTVQVTDYALNPDKFLQNIGYGEPGFDKMIELTGRNSKVVKENIDQLIDLTRKIEQADIPEAFRLIQRRFALGGVRSGLKTFSFGAAAGVSGAAAFGPAPVIAGLLARFTGDFLSSPNVLKRYSQMIAEDAPMTVKRTAYVNILRDFYKTITGSPRMDEFPDEFKTYKGAVENPEGFMDWLLGTGYQDSMSAVGNPGAANDYSNLRYNESEKTNLDGIVQEEVEDSAMNNIVSTQPSAPTQRVDMPEVPSMGNENIMAGNENIMAGASPMATNPRPMNQQQRAALASGDIDAALALRGQV
tara:strand:+ start:806 stop:3742 length:2937 start_codon:yes stop_codon:yes gene_type:complete